MADEYHVADPTLDAVLDFCALGQIDGSHHKTWVIDQIARTILGDKYDEFVEWYEQDGEYEWEIGIAP